jgi:prophage DNA circulation protein
MASRFDPLTALEGAFLGFPFKLAGERGEGGIRGPVHEYPDRDLPFFEKLGRSARRFDLSVYFVGPSADLQAALFDKLLWKGTAGPLILPGLRRETMLAQKWNYQKEAGRAQWVRFDLHFVEVGRNTYPAPSTSWPHALLDAALSARTAFGDALGEALSLVGLDGGPLGQEAVEDLIGRAQALGTVLNVAAQLAAGDAPSTALASAALLTLGYTRSLGPSSFDGWLATATFAAATVQLLGGWADALAGPSPDLLSRSRAIESMFVVYGEGASDSWYAPEALTPLELAGISNQGALSSGIRRVALAEIARQAASLDFASYDDAALLRGRLADAFDDEINLAGNATAPGGRSERARVALQHLRAATLQAISDAGADKARLVPYAVPRPRPALAMAQLFYGGDADVTGRAGELVARTGAIHPAFLPAKGERLSK